MKGGLIRVWIWWLRLWRLRIWWLWFWRRVRFAYSIVYFVNYHRCRLLVLKKKKPLKGLLSMTWRFFTRCIVYFINHCRCGLLVVYLEPLDLLLKNGVEGSTKYAFFKSFSTLVQSFQSFLHILI